MKEKTEFARHFREVQPKFARLCMRSLSRSGLTMPQYALLNLLAANGAVSMRDLSERMHVTKPAVTNLVDRLEKHDFLKRGPDLKDRRVTMIDLRPKGTMLVRDMQSTVLGFLLRTLEGFSRSERSVITRFYKMLSKNFDQNLLKKKAGKLISLSLAVMLLINSSHASAMARRPDKTPPEAELATASLAVSKVPKVFNFETFIKLALSRSEIVKTRREDIMIARAKTFQALGEAIGDGDFVISHDFKEKQAEDLAGTGVGSTFNAPHRRERKFMFSQPIFQGFKSVSALMGAGSLKSQRAGELEFSKEEIFVEAADAFYALVSAEKDITIIGESQKLFEDRIKDLIEREKIGRSRAGEVAMARAKMKILEARVAKARGTLLSAQSLVGFYTGSPHAKVEDEDPETFSETADLNPSSYPDLAAKRSDVLAAKLAVNTARQTIFVKQSALWPKVTLDANHYEKREGFQDGISWDALIKINVPLYRGGENVGQILEATANYRKAKFNYELVRKQAVLEIEQMHQGWIAAREQHRAYQEAVKASEENFNFQKEDYAHSLVSNLEVLAALEEFLAIRESANRAQYEMKTNYWKLQIAISSRIPEWAE